MNQLAPERTVKVFTISTQRALHGYHISRHCYMGLFVTVYKTGFCFFLNKKTKITRFILNFLF